MDVFNEELYRLLKKKIKASPESVDDLSIRFDYEGQIRSRLPGCHWAFSHSNGREMSR